MTSGNPDNAEGGVGNPPPNEAGTPADTSTADTSTANACPANTKQTTKYSATCQAATEAECCTELVNCYGLTGTDITAANDCNVYAACLADCAKPFDDGAAPSQQEISDCQDLCDANSPLSIQTAHAALSDCQTTKPAASAACQ